MNGHKAKEFRRQVYGDLSLKQKRRYLKIGGMRVNTGVRSHYQALKRSYVALGGTRMPVQPVKIVQG